MVRCFEDNDIVHVNGKVDPKSDIDVINLELIFTDLDQVHYGFSTRGFTMLFFHFLFGIPQLASGIHVKKVLPHFEFSWLFTSLGIYLLGYHQAINASAI